VSALDSGKPFDELTDAELDELDAYDWSSGQIMRAISMGLDRHDMEAVALLLRRLATKDPKAAAAILAVIEAAS
jgi:hypothetical protein